MIRLCSSGVYLVNGTLVEQKNMNAGVNVPEARRGTIAYRILQAHSHGGDDSQLHLRFDSLASHDITYVGIIQTARASGMSGFPMPYVLTNCHNSLCAVGGTINEDDHKFALSAARKYGGIYVPPNMSIIHTYNREMMSGCGRMILGSDSHTRYGALGTMAVGEGGGELAKQLLGRTYDFSMPPVIAVYLEGEITPGVGPHDVALALCAAVYKNGFVKNKVLEFVGPGIKNLPVEFRSGIDVMTTETACWSSIWQTDGAVELHYAALGRPEAYRKLEPAETAYYDGCVRINLSEIEPMIALPVHPSLAFPIREVKENARDILLAAQQEANRAFAGAGVQLDLLSKLHCGEFCVDQGTVAGCAGGTFDNLCAVADILEGNCCGNSHFRLSIYPGSMPIYSALLKNGALSRIVDAGAVVRECFCGPCFGACDAPANGELSIRHTTRNFPNREGSKPGDGQIAGVALMDARSIAATAVNGGRLMAATELRTSYTNPAFFFDGALYRKCVFNAVGHAQPETELVMGPNIKDWPALPALSDALLFKIVSRLTDPVTTTDELIPSGETSAYRSNPLRLAEFALCRKDPAYVPASKAVHSLETAREQGEEAGPELVTVYAALRRAGAAGIVPRETVIASAVYAHKPGDGSAREQAASCQRVLGGGANVAREYATKRYRTNCINWGIVPFRTEDDTPFTVGAWVYVPDLADALREGRERLSAWIVNGGETAQTTLLLDPLTETERDTLLSGCLINYYRAQR